MVKVEQEYGHILGNAKKNFVAEWALKYTPAIIAYGQKCGRRAITIIDDLSEHGMSLNSMLNLVYSSLYHVYETSKQTVALKIFGSFFAVRAGKNMLGHLHQEYDVRVNNHPYKTRVVHIMLA